LSSHLFLVRDGKVLLARRFKTGYEDGKYSLVAGHVEGKETVFDSIVREAKEEAGLDLDPGSLKMVHVMHYDDNIKEYVAFFVSATSRGEPVNLEPEKCDHMDWFSVDALPDMMVPYIRQALEGIRKKEFYSEYKV
jgi:8-oxo-dGTP pyrophosphatase MutT (NUDIX family)